MPGVGLRSFYTYIGADGPIQTVFRCKRDAISEVTGVPVILFLLFVVIPALEIAAFIEIGSLIGVLPTLAGIVVTAVVGAWVVRYQGLKVLSEAQTALQNHTVPVEPVLHGVFILIAGVLLMTPGYVTDTLGALLLVPPLRLFVARRIWNWLKNRADVTVVSRETTSTSTYRYDPAGKTIDVEAVEVTEEEHKQQRPNSSSPWSAKD